MKDDAARLPARDRPEDGHWDWRWKKADARHDSETWVIEKAEWFSRRPRTQGVAIIQPESSPLPHGVALIEIAYLTTSLHNRPKIVNGVAAGEGFYRGVGLSLMTIAGERSTANGFGGLIGLYALPGAVPFYKKVGLTMYPQHTKENGILVYFEGKLC